MGHLTAQLRRPSAAWRRRDPSPDASQRGSTTLEATIVLPVVLLVVATIIQVGLYLSARNIAAAAAQAGVDAARVLKAPAGAGTAAARQYLAMMAPDLAAGAQVSGTAGARVSVSVSTKSPTLVPGLPLPPISARADAATERYTAP